MPERSQARIFPILFFGFIFGIWLASVVSMTGGFFLIFCLALCIFYFSTYFIRGFHKKKILLMACFLLGGLLGMGRMYISDLYSPSDLSTFVGKRISAEGIVVAEPDTRETNTKLTIR